MNLDVKKHAYLIMCHNNWEILKVLLQMIDYEENDIYLHIDKHVKKYSQEELKEVVKKSSITFVKRVKVNWGGYSQIKAEMSLLESAVKTTHRYYHLISGVDLSIKSQEYIHQFFEENNGKNYLDFVDVIDPHLFRIGVYHLFQEQIGRGNDFIARIARKMEKVSLKIQKAFKVDRVKKAGITFYKGANWFSITDDLARYVVQQKKTVRKYFRCSVCADELFLQTIAMQSPYADSLQNENLRFTDWERGNPYTFREEDFEVIVKSGKLFARKFDEHVDMKVVRMIEKYVIDKRYYCLG